MSALHGPTLCACWPECHPLVRLVHDAMPEAHVSVIPPWVMGSLTEWGSGGRLSPEADQWLKARGLELPR